MKLARYSNFTFRYTDDVLSLNNYKFDDFVDRVYPIEHEIKDTTNPARCTSQLDLHLEIDSEDWFRTQRYKKTDDFKFLIVDFPFICSTIPAAPAYHEYISLNRCEISEPVVPTGISVVEGCWQQGSY